MQKIMVLGGSGFVGKRVCAQLVEAGWAVTVPTRARSHAAALTPLAGMQLLELDVHDEAALTHSLAGHTAVVNLVAILHGTRAAFEQVHVALPHKLLRACRAAGVGSLVHISAMGASDVRPEQAPSMYLRSKGQGEAALLHPSDRASGPTVTVIRPSVIFGPGDKFLNVFAQLQAVLPVMPLAGASVRFQPVWVDDVAHAVVTLLARQVHGGATPGAAEAACPPVVEACGPEVFTLAELVRLAGQLRGVNAGRGRPVLALPNWLARLQARLMELAPGEPLMTRDNLDSMKIDNVASGKVAGLQALRIEPAALRPIAARYLQRP